MEGGREGGRWCEGGKTGGREAGSQSISECHQVSLDHGDMKH